MRFCRFDDNRLGVVTGDEIRDVTAVLDRLPPLSWPVPPATRTATMLPAGTLTIAASVAGAPCPVRKTGALPV